MDAKSDERSCGDSQPSSENGSPMPCVSELIQELRTTNLLLAALVEQNQRMLQVLLADEVEYESDMDLSGNSIMTS